MSISHEETVSAIQFIRPDAEFILNGDELTWLDKNQTEPTTEEIEAGLIGYKNKIEAEKTAAEEKRIATLAKLEALGLDEDDLKALGL